MIGNAASAIQRKQAGKATECGQPARPPILLYTFYTGRSGSQRPTAMVHKLAAEGPRVQRQGAASRQQDVCAQQALPLQVARRSRVRQRWPLAFTVHGGRPPAPQAGPERGRHESHRVHRGGLCALWGACGAPQRCLAGRCLPACQRRRTPPPARPPAPAVVGARVWSLARGKARRLRVLHPQRHGQPHAVGKLLRAAASGPNAGQLRAASRGAGGAAGPARPGRRGAALSKPLTS